MVAKGRGLWAGACSRLIKACVLFVSRSLSSDIDRSLGPLDRIHGMRLDLALIPRLNTERSNTSGLEESLCIEVCTRCDAQTSLIFKTTTKNQISSEMVWLVVCIGLIVNF